MIVLYNIRADEICFLYKDEEFFANAYAIEYEEYTEYVSHDYITESLANNLVILGTL